MMKKSTALLLISLAALLFPPGAFADKRTYIWTYEYKTVEKGRGEVEYYFTLSTPDIETLKGTMGSEHQIELEIGMNERFDFSIYQVFEQKTGEKFKYKKFKLRSRYKIGEKGQFILDPLIYMEYKGIPDFSEHEIELKLILARDMRRFNISLNPIFEFEQKEKWEFKPEYTMGMSYEINKILNVGLEVKGSEYGHYIGPVISHGKENLWIALGTAFKIAEIEAGKPEFQIRMILGIELK